MIIPDGYIKVLNGRYHDKQYKAWLVMPGKVDRVARRPWRTAALAIEYGKKLAERYNRMYPPAETAVEPCEA